MSNTKIGIKLGIIAIFIAACVGIFFVLPNDFSFLFFKISLVPIKIAFGIGFLTFLLSLMFLGIAQFKGISKKTKNNYEEKFNLFYMLSFILMIAMIIFSVLIVVSNEIATLFLKMEQATLSVTIYMILIFSIIGILGIYGWFKSGQGDKKLKKT